jgi:hypothetical protein
MDPQVVMAEILQKLDRIVSALEPLDGIDESLGLLTDYAEAADGALGEIFEKGGRERFNAAAFLRAYGQIRDQQDAEAEEAGDGDDDDDGGMPGPGAGTG